MSEGKAVAWLDPGLHRFWKVRDRGGWVRAIDLAQAVLPVQGHEEIAARVPSGEAETLHVGAEEVAIVSIDGHPLQCLQAGVYLLWQQRHEVTAVRYSIKALRTEIPEYAWSLVPESILRVHTVHSYERGILYVDGQMVEQLSAGRYGLHTAHRNVALRVVDMREQELQIQGQEVMPADKVTLRINLIVTFRLRDALKSVVEQSNLRQALYSEAQMSARRQIAGVGIDDLLEARNAASCGARSLRDLLK